MTGINTIDDAGANLIKSYERCRLTAYALGDGKWTIGWGNTFYEDGTEVKEGDVITQERADELFASVVKQFEDQVNNDVTQPLTQNQFNALVSFTYNLGDRNLEISTLLKEVDTNPNNPDIRNQFMRWVEPGTQFTVGLTRRRNDEANMYFTA